MKQTLRKHIPSYAEQMAKFRESPESESESEGEPSDASASDSASDDSDVESLDSEAEAERQFKTVRSGVVARPKDKIMTMNPAEITYEMVQKKLQEISLARGKTTSLDRQDQVEMLAHLAAVARGPVQKVDVLINMITVIFDMNQPTVTPMSTPNWNRCGATLFEVMELLAENPQIKLVDSPPEEERTAEPVDDGASAPVWGNLAAILERLDDEWSGSLKSLDPHAHEYMERLKDEVVLLALAQSAEELLDSTSQLDRSAGIALRRIDHLYNKTSAVYSSVRNLAEVRKLSDHQAAAPPQSSTSQSLPVDGEEENGDAAAVTVLPRLPADFQLPEHADDLIQDLASKVYAHGNDNQKGQALLCTVYWRCIHDDFYRARDALLASRIQEQTAQLENRMQVLYNRAVAQLGLCAFRAGLITEAHQCLVDLYGTGRAKELLAQGIHQHRFAAEKSAEQEAAERRRQVPFHLHINLELLESVYLTSALLLEVPSIAALGVTESRKRPISKPLRRLIDNYERQTFVGPPENVRDHAMAAARALGVGDWRAAHAYIASLSCWGLLPQKEQVLSMLRSKFQQEGLRTYLLAHAKHYSSLSVKGLCDDFELPEPKVHALVSKLIADELLPASHDQPSATIVVHHEEPTRLQTLANAFADRATILVDLNERALALRTGVLHSADDDEDGARRGGGQDGQQQQGGAQGGRRTRLGGRGPLGFSDNRSRRGGRGGRGGGGGGGGGGGRYGGFMGDVGYGGGVFGRGRARATSHKDDSTYMQLGRVSTGYSRGT